MAKKPNPAELAGRKLAAMVFKMPSWPQRLNTILASIQLHMANPSDKVLKAVPELADSRLRPAIIAWAIDTINKVDDASRAFDLETLQKYMDLFPDYTADSLRRFEESIRDGHVIAEMLGEDLPDNKDGEQKSSIFEPTKPKVH